MTRPALKRTALVAVKCVLIAVFAGPLYETDDLFMMVQGSDSTSFLVTPTVTVQIVCLVIFAAALLLPASHRLRAGLLAVALLAALLGSHRLVIDNLHGEIRDVYLAVAWQSLALDPSHEGGLALNASSAGFSIGQAGTRRTLWCFSPGVLGLDASSVKNLVQ
jgi:hypothetical protein